MNRPPEKKDAKAIFSAAIEYYMPDQWEGYIVNACGDDEALRQRVRELLDAHRHSDSLFDREERMTEGPPISERAGTQIGPYKLLQEIGEGGFGVVYMAEQIEPVRRKVALKIIKPGMDTKQVIARFEAERQALAMMDHPNIAKVLGAGTTESGRPYFVMELVKGVPVTEFCDANKLPTRDRLELFVTVCHAVQHAHQKGVIHRDLKPSNVMVTVHDNKPMPVIIDFGVSKAISHQLTEKTLFTAYGQMVGTPVYMSPEQAQMSRMDIDTRSDIYSLGVLLYELLTGSTPLDAEQLRGTAYAEMQRLIREEEAPKPSTRLSTLGNALAEIALARGTDPKKLGQFLRGDLDWIVLKALEKERNRRYDTANGLANDIERFLNDEAVEATPPSLSYQLRKFVSRNRGLATTAAAVAAAVLLGIIGTTIGMFQARRDAARAEQASARLVQKSSQLVETNTELTTTNDELHAEQQRSQQLISQLRRQSATMAVDKGNRLIRADDVFPGMLWLTRGLELAEQEPSLVGFAKNIRRGLAAVQATVPQLARVITPDHSIERAVYSQDGSRIAVSGWPWPDSGMQHENQITIWDNQTGQLLARTTLDKGPQSLDFRPDGKSLLIASNRFDQESQFLMTLDFDDGATQRYELPENLIPEKAVFGNDDVTIHLLAKDVEQKKVVLVRLTVDDGRISRSAGHPLRVSASWLQRTARIPNNVSGTAPSPLSLLLVSAFSDDRTTAVTATANGVMRWNLTDEETDGQRLPIDDVAEHPVYSIRISPNAAAALIDYGTRLALYRLADGHLLWEIPFDPQRVTKGLLIGTGKPSVRLFYEPRPVVFSADSRTFLVYEPTSKESRSRLEVRSTETGQLLDAFHDVCRSGRAGIAWLRGKDAFVVGSQREAMVFRFPTTSALAGEGRFRSGKINQSVGDIIVNFGLRDVRALRDITTGQIRMHLSNAGVLERRNESMLVTTAGDTLIQLFQRRRSSGGFLGRPRSGPVSTVEVYNSPTGEKRFEYQPENAWDTKLSPNGRWIAHSSSRNQSRHTRFSARLVDIYDADNRARMRTIEAVGSEGRILEYAFSGDGRQLAVAWTESSKSVAEVWVAHVDVWDIGEQRTEPTRKPIWQHPVRGRSLSVVKLQFNKQGDKLLSRIADEVWVLDVDETDRATRVHNKATQAALLPDGQGVVVLDSDDRVQLVDVETRQVFPLRFGAQGASRRMLLSPDASVLGTTTDSEACPVGYWRMPVPVTESAAELQALLETASHLRLTEHGDIELLGANSDSPQTITAVGHVDRTAQPNFITQSEFFAVKMLDQQQWATAIPLLEQLIERNPRNLWARAWRCRCLIELDRFEDAESEMQQLEEITPRDPGYATAIAVSLARRIEELDSQEDELRIAALRSLAVLTSEAPDEVLREISASHAERGRWEPAIESLQQASQINPEHQWYLYAMTPLALMAGDEDLYQRTCRDLLDRWSDDTVDYLRERAAKANLLKPVSDDFLQQAAALADGAYQERPDYVWFQSTKGLADYRRGDYASAEQILTAVVEEYEERAEDSPAVAQLVVLSELLLAMTYHQLEQPDKAKELLDRASQRIDSQWDRHTGRFIDQYHHDWLIAVIIRREAEMLISGVASSGEALPDAPPRSATPASDDAPQTTNETKDESTLLAESPTSNHSGHVRNWAPTSSSLSRCA